MTTISQKVCIACKVSLPLTSFASRRLSPDGLQYTCRECVSAYCKEHHKKKKARIEARRAKAVAA